MWVLTMGLVSGTGYSTYLGTCHELPTDQTGFDCTGLRIARFLGR
uniref:Uncharacterized protein n=1 Tax=Arundo donax TaxID=35708 RepID=A0A0A9AS91_ARUDO